MKFHSPTGLFILFFQGEGVNAMVLILWFFRK
jgi:hypothetical protein